MTTVFESSRGLTRRTFLKALSVSAGPVALPSILRANAQAASLPNIVIIYADDMGYGDLAAQNPDSKIPTPHLDRLALEGIRFTDAHSSSGICTPSRFALLTGMYHWRKFHGIVNSFDGPVFDDELTLPAMLRKQGYSTACIGKWHLGWDWEAIRVDGRHTAQEVPRPDDFDWLRPVPGGPLSRGFDYYFGDDVPNFPPYAWIENDHLLTIPTEMYAPAPVPEEGNHEGRPGPMTPGWKLDAVMPRLTERAVSWIAAQKGRRQPFFLYFAWTSPHAPIVPAPEFKGRTGAGPYGDFVYQSDCSAGRILQALDAHGLRENTLVIFTSDNGPEHYAYERVRACGHRSMGPLRGLKRDIYEGGHRVPLLMRWPAMIAPGSVSDALISQVDFMATIAALTGYALPDGAALDSYNMTPLLRGESPDAPIRTVHVHNTLEDHYALRQEDWVYLDVKSGAHSKVPDWYNEENGYAPNPHEKALYNLRDDISQRVNLIEQYPERAAAMKQTLEQLRLKGHRA
mgnify:FL=1